MEKDWLNSLKNRMDDFEESVPDGLWEGIEASMPQSRKSVVLPWVWRSIAAAAALALGVFAGVRLLDSGRNPVLAEVETVVTDDEPSAAFPAGTSGVEESSSPVRESVGKTVKRIEIVPAESREILVADAGEAVKSAPGSSEETESGVPVSEKENSGTGPGIAGAGTSGVTEDNEDDVVDEQEAAGAVGNASGDDGGMVKEEFADGFRTTHDGEDWSDYLPAGYGEKARSAGRPGVNLSMAGAPNDIQDNNVFNARQFYRGLAMSSSSGDELASGGGSQGNDQFVLAEPVSPVITSSDVTSYTNHKAPFRVGLSFRLPLYKRLSLESGLTYSKLTSAFGTVSGNRTNEDKQVLQYVGIPVNLNLDVIRLKWMSVYLSGGATAEKCVSARIKTSSYVDGDRVGDVSVDKLSVKPLLWSVNAAAGVQLNVFGNIGIYAEPGLSYHFDDGSKVQTAYKERPLDGLLTFGLRYTFN